MNWNASDGTLSQLVLTNNYAVDGGGLYSRYSSPTLEHCLIADCYGSVTGGGIAMLESEPVIRACPAL